MPLKKGFSKRSIAANIKAEMIKHPNMPHKQAVAIAMSIAEKAKEKSKKRGT